MPFKNRIDAGQRLAADLIEYKDKCPLVLALPRGGVPVAAEIARGLNGELDILLVRKIGAPFQPELAIGAVVDGPHPMIVRNEDVMGFAGVTDSSFQAALNREQAEIERRRQRYLGPRAPASVKGRLVIVVDDGIATGATMRAALKAVRAGEPERLILAVPVAPPDSLQALKAYADATHCLEVHEPFGAIGYFYADFEQLTDETVIHLLSQARRCPPPGTDR